MEIISSKPVKAGERHDCHIPHPQPARGKPGPQGEAATIEIVDVVTVEPTDPARVENLGDASNAKFVLYIPKGDQGNVGQDGTPGEPGDDYILTQADKEEIAGMIDVNVDGVTGGYYTPEVTQVDADTMTVSFTASGDKMPPVPSASITLPAGPQGEQGPQGIQGIQGEKGEKGDTGATGAQGIQGEKGEKGDTGEAGKDGSDYVLTEADKQEIADMVIIVNTEQPEETGVFWYDPDDEESEDGGTTELQPLTFTGAVEATYDGSEAVSVEIPSGGGGSGGKFVNKTYSFELTESADYIDIDLGGTYDIMQVYGNGFIPATEVTTLQWLYLGKDTMGQWNRGFGIGSYRAWTVDYYIHFRVFNNVHNPADAFAEDVVMNTLYGVGTAKTGTEIAKDRNWGFLTPDDKTGLFDCSVLRLQFQNRQRKFLSGAKFTITINALEV